MVNVKNVNRITAQLMILYESVTNASTPGAANSLKKCKQSYKKKVDNYIELVEKPGLQKLERLKLVSLIIIDEHNREIIEMLHQQKVTSP